MKRKDWIWIGLAVLLAGSGLAYRLVKSHGAESEATTAPEAVTVTLLGAVWYPGSYEVAEGTTLERVIALAGGVTEEADVESLVLDEAFYQDTTRLVSCRVKLVSINESDAKTLATLPRIGATIAARIVSYRTEHGAFSALAELLKVPGMTESIYGAIKDQISL